MLFRVDSWSDQQILESRDIRINTFHLSMLMGLPLPSLRTGINLLVLFHRVWRLFYTQSDWNTRGRRDHLKGAFVMYRLARALGQSVPDVWRVQIEPPQHDFWEEMCKRDPMLTGRPQAATRIQRIWRHRRRLRREAAARRIQQGCMPWILKPRTRDGKLGINFRLLMALPMPPFEKAVYAEDDCGHLLADNSN